MASVGSDGETIRGVEGLLLVLSVSMSRLDKSARESGILRKG
jgi:hypothetical protein